MKGNIEIKKGPLEVISSGSLFGKVGEDPLVITLIDDESPIDIIIIFEKSQENNRPNVITSVKNNNTALEFRFINYNNPYGSKSDTAIPIGMYFHRTLYFEYAIYAISVDIKKIDYVLYVGNEASHG